MPITSYIYIHFHIKNFLSGDMLENYNCTKYNAYFNSNFKFSFSLNFKFLFKRKILNEA